MTLAEHSATFCYPPVPRETTAGRCQTPIILGIQTDIHASSSNGRCVPAAVSWCPLLHGPSASPGGWGLWGAGPDRCLQQQGLRDPGGTSGAREHSNGCCQYPSLGVLWGYGTSPGVMQVVSKPAKVLANPHHPYLCLVFALQIFYKVLQMSPITLVNLICLSKTAATSEEDTPPEGSGALLIINACQWSVSYLFGQLASKWQAFQARHIQTASAAGSCFYEERHAQCTDVFSRTTTACFLF